MEQERTYLGSKGLVMKGNSYLLNSTNPKANEVINILHVVVVKVCTIPLDIAQ